MAFTLPDAAQAANPEPTPHHAPPPLPKTAVGAALSKMIAAAIGDIVVVMSRAPGRKHHALGDIEWMVLPPVLARQFYVAEAAAKDTGFRAPIAVVTWARVSTEVDRRLTENAGREPVRLRPDEWTSGEQHWLIDLIGNPAGLRSALRDLRAGALKDKDVKVLVREQSGAARVATLAELAAEAQRG